MNAGVQVNHGVRGGKVSLARNRTESKTKSRSNLQLHHEGPIDVKQLAKSVARELKLMGIGPTNRSPKLPVRTTNGRVQPASPTSSDDTMKVELYLSARKPGKDSKSQSLRGTIFINSNDRMLVDHVMDEFKSKDTMTKKVQDSRGRKVGSPIGSKRENILLNKMLERVDKTKLIMDEHGYDTDQMIEEDQTEMARLRQKGIVVFERRLFFSRPRTARDIDLSEDDEEDDEGEEGAVGHPTMTTEEEFEDSHDEDQKELDEVTLKAFPNSGKNA